MYTTVSSYTWSELLDNGQTVPLLMLMYPSDTEPPSRSVVVVVVIINCQVRLID
jgi:hypothetical protein